jgi:hypothetical protein
MEEVWEANCFAEGDAYAAAKGDRGFWELVEPSDDGPHGFGIAACVEYEMREWALENSDVLLGEFRAKEP